MSVNYGRTRSVEETIADPSIQVAFDGKLIHEVDKIAAARGMTRAKCMAWLVESAVDLWCMGSLPGGRS